MEKSRKIDIVMVTWNRMDITELSIRTLAKNTKTPSRLIVVDNHSTLKMRNMLKELKKSGFIDTLIILPENAGLEPAKNVGLQEVTSDLFVSTDNDILPEKPVYHEDWLYKLVKLMDLNEEYGSIACRTQVMIGSGNIYDGHEHEDIVEFSHPGGSLRIMRTDIVKRVGGWRNEMGGRGQEEMYICGRLREQGLKNGFAVDVKCYHMFGNDGNWGYGSLEPEEHGHKPVWHPAIINGDDDEDIRRYV